MLMVSPIPDCHVAATFGACNLDISSDSGVRGERAFAYRAVLAKPDQTVARKQLLRETHIGRAVRRIARLHHEPRVAGAAQALIDKIQTAITGKYHSAHVHKASGFSFGVDLG